MARAAKEAAAALRFLSRLTVPEGRTAGKRLKLARYQRDFVRAPLLRTRRALMRLCASLCGPVDPDAQAALQRLPVQIGR